LPYIIIGLLPDSLSLLFVRNFDFFLRIRMRTGRYSGGKDGQICDNFINGGRWESNNPQVTYGHIYHIYYVILFKVWEIVYFIGLHNILQVEWNSFVIVEITAKKLKSDHFSIKPLKIQNGCNGIIFKPWTQNKNPYSKIYFFCLSNER
jgi:hypothetical protein